MKNIDATELAYKNGYVKGYEDGKCTAIRYSYWDNYKCANCGATAFGYYDPFNDCIIYEPKAFCHDCGCKMVGGRF